MSENRQIFDLREPGLLPFTVLWQLLSFVPLSSLIALRGVSRAWDEVSCTIYVDILIEAFIATVKRYRPSDSAGAFPDLARLCVLQPGKFRHPYLDPRRRGSAGERVLVGIVDALGRTDTPPPNMVGIFDALVPKPTGVLFVPPTTPMGQLLLRWWDLAAKSPQMRSAITDIARIPFGLTSRASAHHTRDVLRSTKPEQVDLQGPKGPTVAAVLHDSLRAQPSLTSPTFPASQNPLALDFFRAFLDDEPAAAANVDGADSVSELHTYRRRELHNFAAFTRCVFYRVQTPDASPREAALDALNHLVNDLLLPTDKERLNTSLRLSGCTAVCKTTSLGPPDADYFNVVPFSLSWHPFPSLDLVSYAVDSAPISVLGLRVTRGESFATATLTIRTLVRVTGELARPESIFAQLGRSWFSQTLNTSVAKKVTALTIVDLTGLGLTVTHLPKDTFTFQMLPSLCELFLPLHFAGFHEASIVDHPKLRTVLLAARAPLTLLYDDAPREQRPAVFDFSAGRALTDIDAQCFRRCNMLEAVIAGPSLRSLGDGVFMRAEGLRVIDLRLCDVLSAIGSQFAMWAPRLHTLCLPRCVEEFRFSALRGCTALRYLPGLEDIVASSVAFGKNSFATTGLQKLRLPRHTVTIDADAFSCCEHLQSVDLSWCRMLKDVAPRAFAQCKRLRTIQFPTVNSSLTKLGAEAFCGLRVASIDLSGFTRLTAIGDGAFTGCASLKTIVFPATLTVVGKRAFSKCQFLTEADFSVCAQLTTIHEGAFAECDLMQMLVLPGRHVTVEDGVAAAGAANFQIIYGSVTAVAAGTSTVTEDVGGEPSGASCGCNVM
jgi:hypothetical protein